MISMTCDEVFDVLTGQRGADGDHDRDVLLRHLGGCRSCRRLADALEPAVQLFRECAASEDGSLSALLPGPWNDVEPSRGESRLGTSRGNWSVLTAAAPSSTPWMWQLFGGDLMRLAAAILVGLTLGALVWGQSSDPAKKSQSAAMQSSFSPHVTLAALRLTAECVPAEHRAPLANSGPRLRPASELLPSALDALACCTLCHTSGGIGASSKAGTLEVVRSCQACHTF
jgi:hypothetical protein